MGIKRRSTTDSSRSTWTQRRGQILSLEEEEPLLIPLKTGIHISLMIRLNQPDSRNKDSNREQVKTSMATLSQEMTFISIIRVLIPRTPKTIGKSHSMPVGMATNTPKETRAMIFQDNNKRHNKKTNRRKNGMEAILSRKKTFIKSILIKTPTAKKAIQDSRKPSQQVIPMTHSTLTQSQTSIGLNSRGETLRNRKSIRSMRPEKIATSTGTIEASTQDQITSRQSILPISG